jgi:hypothetical protein
MGLASLANFSLQPFLGTWPGEPPDTLRFGLPLASDGAVLNFPFALRCTPFFSTMTCLMASRSGNKICVDLGTVEWLRLYWFCHNIRTDNSTMAARSALLKGILPFFIAVLQRGEVFDIVIQHSHTQDMLSHSGTLGLVHYLLYVELLPFSSISTYVAQDSPGRTSTFVDTYLQSLAHSLQPTSHTRASCGRRDPIRTVHCRTAGFSVARTTQGLPCHEPSGLLGASDESAQSPPCRP